MNGFFNDSRLICTFLNFSTDRGPGRFSEKFRW